MTEAQNKSPKCSDVQGTVPMRDSRGMSNINLCLLACDAAL